MNLLVDADYCPFYEDCRFGTLCGQAYTESVKIRAKKQNKIVNLLTEKPKCFENLIKLVQK